jgi:hypothetical protein
MPLDFVEVPGIALGRIVGHPWDFDLDLALGDLFGDVERERAPSCRKAEGSSCCLDLAPQFQQLLLSPLRFVEVGPESELVLDQLLVPAMFSADLTSVFALVVQLPVLPIACWHTTLPLSRVSTGDECPIWCDKPSFGLLASRNRTYFLRFIGLFR